jgi:putative DNA primase/helicase
MRKVADMTTAAMQALERGDLSPLRNTQNGHGGELDGAVHIEAARALLAKLDDQIQADVGAAFNSEVVDALKLAQRRDPPTWARAKQVLQKRHISLKEVQRAITNRGTALSENPDYRQGGRVGDALPDCPAPGTRLPAGFALDREGTWEWTTQQDSSGGEPVFRRLVAHAPILISARFRNVETGVEALRIHWRRPDGWRALTVDRSIALDARRILELAGEGFPVFSDNARKLTKYLAEAEALNWSMLPTIHVSAHLGWQGRDGEHGFLVGRRLITSDGELIETPGLGVGGEVMTAGGVSFRGVTAGDEQIVDAYHSRDSKEEWMRAIAKLKRHPRAMVALYASFVPPLLQIIRCPNFIIDWAYRTSAGKTTLLRMAVSVWGNPNENEPDAAMRSWDSTQVYIERCASISSGLPLILDETKRVKDLRQVANVLYEVATGQGRGRGTVKGTAATRTWRTVLLSTGEAPAVSFTQDGGTRARCLEIRGAPFGKTNADTAEMV